MIYQLTPQQESEALVIGLVIGTFENFHTLFRHLLSMPSLPFLCLLNFRNNATQRLRCPLSQALFSLFTPL